MKEKITVDKDFFNKICQFAATSKHTILKARKLIKKWREESSHSPIRLPLYGGKDSLEHCADELEHAIGTEKRYERTAKEFYHD